MDIPDSLRCMFTGAVEERNGSYIVTLPEREFDIGQLEEGEVYRIALLGSDVSAAHEEGSSTKAPPTDTDIGPDDIEVGDIYEVEIEDIGDKGDGLARIGEGYIVFVPGTNIGDKVTVEITEARETVAFAEPIS